MEQLTSLSPRRRVPEWDILRTCAFRAAGAGIDSAAALVKDLGRRIRRKRERVP